MIIYDPLWATMKNKGITTYFLITNGIRKGTIHRLKHNLPVSTQTIDSLCQLIHCKPGEILDYISNDT